MNYTLLDYFNLFILHGTFVGSLCSTIFHFFKINISLESFFVNGLYILCIFSFRYTLYYFHYSNRKLGMEHTNVLF